MASLLGRSSRALRRTALSARGRNFSTTKAPTTQVTTLSNGIRVATEKVDNGANTATVGVFVDTGSRYENEQNNGVAHFLEHMFFKGTGSRTRAGLEKEVENMGGHLNAYTSREQTVFYAKAFDKDVPQAVDILSDILLNSKFTPEAIEQERSVILREMQEVESQMEEVIFDRLHQTAYRGTALGRTILGPPENINSISREDIIDYIGSHYTADRMVIAGAGNVDHGELVKQCEEKFSKVPRKGTRAPVFEPARFIGSDIRVREDSMPLLHVAYGFETAGWLDADNFPLMVIQSMMGSWDSSNMGGKHSSSELVSTLCEHDLVQSVTAFNTQYSDTGLFGAYITCEDKAAWEAMDEVGAAITKFCYHVDEGLLDEAKTRLTMTMLSQLDGSTVVCEDVGRQVLTYGRRMSTEETIARINAVDVAAVKACANRFFYDRDFALASVGPSYELPDYNHLRRNTYWLTQ